MGNMSIVRKHTRRLKNKVSIVPQHNRKTRGQRSTGFKRSSFIRDVSYDKQKNEMCVVIGENAYIYKGVPYDTYVSQFHAARPGEFFGKYIKGKYEFTKKAV